MRRFGICVALLMVVLPRFAFGQEPGGEIRVSDEAVALVWHNREIFVFRAVVDINSPRERVQAAQTRLDLVPIGIAAPEVVTRPFLGATAVVVGNQHIFAITNEDLPPDVLPLTVDKSLVHLGQQLGWAISPDSPLYPVAKITLAQTAPILPYLLLVLILLRPRGLLGSRED